MIGVDVPDFATPVNPDRAWMLHDQGPACIPARGLSGEEFHARASYGRYVALDLTENNRASIDAWCARNPDRPRPDLGWGVCRQGFGLQLARDGRPHDAGGYMDREAAEAYAAELNAAIRIGELP